MATEQTLSVKVTPTWDERAAKKAIDDATAVFRRLSKMKVEWASLATQANTNIKNINNLSAAAKEFGNKLSTAARSSFKELQNLGNQLEEATETAEALQSQMKAAKTTGMRKALETEYGRMQKKISGLNKQIGAHQKLYAKEGFQLKKMAMLKSREQADIMKFKGFFGKDMLKEMGGALRAGVAKGGLKGALGALGGVAGAAGKGVAGAGARQMAAGMGGGGMTAMAKMIPAIMKLVPAITGIVGVLGMFWKVITAVDGHMKKLNQTILEGTATANDWAVGTGQYTKIVDEYRDALLGSAESLLKFGVNSKQAGEIVNKFVVESTGSMSKMQDVFRSFGGGGSGIDAFNKGVGNFVQNAIGYAKALGMQTTEVATMMGKFVSETGYGATQVQDVMSDIVVAARQSNMPMTKFMGIFRTVLPDVELYQNRLEELTTTIKMLSKSMSAKRVKQFMDAFAKGFKGTSFKQRLKTVLIAGTGPVSKRLTKDFTGKARMMAKQFNDYVSGDEMVAALRGGTKGLADIVATAQMRASKEGKRIEGKIIGEAMALAQYEEARQKGTAPDMATAISGASSFTTFQILKDMSGAFTSSFSGLDEHIMKGLGITEQQYEAMKSMDAHMQTQKTLLRKFGKTNDAVFNQMLVELIANKEYAGDTSKVLMKDMQAADEEMIHQAEMNSKAVMNNNIIQIDAKDLAAEQVDATLSIAEKLENVIGYLLERIYTVLFDFLKPIFDSVDSVWGWLSSGKSTKELIQSQRKYLEDTTGGAHAAVRKEVATAMVTSAEAGGTSPEDLAKAAGAAWERSFGKGGVQGYYGGAAPTTPEEQEASERRNKEVLNWITKGQGKKKYGPSSEMSKLATSITTAIGKGDWATLGKDLQTVSEHSGVEVQQILHGFTTDFLTQAKGLEIAGDVIAKNAKREIDPMRRKTRKEGLEAEEFQRKGILEKEQKEKRRAGYGEVAELTSIKGLENMPALSSVAELTGGSGGGGGGGGGAGKSPKTKPVTADVSKENTTNIVESASKNTKLLSDRLGEVQGSPTSLHDVVDQCKDIAGILRAGIAYDTGFLTGSYKATIKDAATEALRTTLMEHAIVMAKIQEDKSFREAFMEYGAQMAGANKTLQDVMSAGGTTSIKTFWEMLHPGQTYTGPLPEKEKEEEKKPGQQAGGWVSQTGMARVHAGELFLNKSGISDIARGLAKSGVTVHNTFNIYGGDTQKIRSVLLETMEDIKRRA